jgi:hypothetical protein
MPQIRTISAGPRPGGGCRPRAERRAGATGFAGMGGSDLGGAARPPSRHAGSDAGEQLAGGGQQVLTLAGAFFGHDGVAAGDEPLAGEVRGADLGQVLLVEQGQLQWPVAGDQLAETAAVVGGRGRRR